MNAISNYIVNMIPYMIIAVPIYLIVRFLMLRKSSRKFNLYHEIALLIFVIFIVGLASQTVIPKIELGINGNININILKNGTHGINLLPLKVLFETYREVFINLNINYFIINFLGNIIMFMPIGFFIPLLWEIPDKKIIIVGFLFSLFIEVCQLFLNRGTDVDDLILNTLGTILGLLVYKFLYKKFKNLIIRFR